MFYNINYILYCFLLINIYFIYSAENLNDQSCIAQSNIDYVFETIVIAYNNNDVITANRLISLLELINKYGVDKNKLCEFNQAITLENINIPAILLTINNLYLTPEESTTVAQEQDILSAVTSLLNTRDNNFHTCFKLLTQEVTILSKDTQNKKIAELLAFVILKITLMTQEELEKISRNFINIVHKKNWQELQKLFFS